MSRERKERKVRVGSGQHASKVHMSASNMAMTQLFPASFDPVADSLSPASTHHVPVLFKEVLSFIQPKNGMRILDGTLGLAGHSEGMLRLLAAHGISDARLLGLDRDTDALKLALMRLAPFEKQVILQKARFSECADVLDTYGWDTVDFALIDIGVSSLQLDVATRGFSFAANGPLDMRMDAQTGISAATLVNKASVNELRQIIEELGEEPMAGRIARAIDDARSKKEIETTTELANIVWEAYPAKWRATARNHPATRTFQALRMAVNGELEELEVFLQAILPRLSPNGRVAVITFHSLEDRLVKHFFRDEATGCCCPRHIPVCVCGHTASLQVLTKKPISAQSEELLDNPRASSAKLRVAEKL